jgi:hypothetical protein
MKPLIRCWTMLNLSQLLSAQVAKPEPGAQPNTEKALYGEAEPRLTSGGKAVSRSTSCLFVAKISRV